MKRKIIYLIAFIIFILLVSVSYFKDVGTSNSLVLTPAPPLEINSDLAESVEISIQRDNEAQREFNLLIGNVGENEIISGNQYLLEYFDESEWKSIPNAVEFTSLGIPILPNTVRNIAIDLPTAYPNKLTGQFRIRTRIHIADDSSASHDLTIEFILK